MKSISLVGLVLLILHIVICVVEGQLTGFGDFNFPSFSAEGPVLNDFGDFSFGTPTSSETEPEPAPTPSTTPTTPPLAFNLPENFNFPAETNNFQEFQDIFQNPASTTASPNLLSPSPSPTPLSPSPSPTPLSPSPSPSPSPTPLSPSPVPSPSPISSPSPSPSPSPFPVPAPRQEYVSQGECSSSVYSYIDPVCSDNAVTPNVVGGENASPSEFPWIISLQLQQSPSCFVHFCTGSLIASNVVLTAAHCVYGRRRSSIFVAHGPACSSQVGKGRLKLSKVKIVNDYNPTTADRDVALLILNGNFNGPFLDPFTDVRLKAGKTALTLVGHGAQSIYSSDNSALLPLQKASNLRFIGASECTDLLGGIPQTRWMICTKAYPEIRDACYGDSGAPLIYRNGGKDIQVGIVSYGPSFGYGCNGVTSYANVARFQGWIARKGFLVNSGDPKVTVTDTATPLASVPSTVQSLKNEFVTAHNNLRSQYCVSPIKWATGLAAKAQAAASECVRQTNVREGVLFFFEYGTTPASPTEVVNEWFYFDDFNEYIYFQSSIVWPDTVRIGCGLETNCRDYTGRRFYQYVCAYAPTAEFEQLGPLPTC